MVKKAAVRGPRTRKAPPKRGPVRSKQVKKGPHSKPAHKPVQEVEDVASEEEMSDAAESIGQVEQSTEDTTQQTREGRVPMMSIRTRRVANSVMKKKWRILSPDSRSQAISILRDIQKPVLMAIKNENRRATAQGIIDATINRIEFNLQKIPLPPGNKDRHFDFERIINENREMEASLVPDLKLIGELEREIEREKNLLENEEAQLINLTKNAAREESSRKTQMKKMHALLRENVASKSSLLDINLVSEPLVPSYDVTADKAISGVLNDLGNHVTTMNANLREMKEVRAWVNRAEVSLGEILRRLGGQEEIDRIYGAEVV